MVEKLSSFYHHISDYATSIIGILVVAVVEVLKVVDRKIQMQLQTTQDASIEVFTVVDGHLLISDLSVVEMLQITLLGLSIVALIAQMLYRCFRFCKSIRRKRHLTKD